MDDLLFFVLQLSSCIIVIRERMEGKNAFEGVCVCEFERYRM
jgi:hypothetical protein